MIQVVSGTVEIMPKTQIVAEFMTEKIRNDKVFEFILPIVWPRGSYTVESPPYSVGARAWFFVS